MAKRNPEEFKLMDSSLWTGSVWGRGKKKRDFFQPYPWYIVVVLPQKRFFERFCRSLISPLTVPSILFLLFSRPTHFLREKPWGRGCYTGDSIQQHKINKIKSSGQLLWPSASMLINKVSDDASIWPIHKRPKLTFAQSKRFSPKQNLLDRENNSMEQEAFCMR